MPKLTRREYLIQRYTSDLSYQFSAAMLYRHSLQCWRIYRRHRRRVYQLQIHWLSIIHQYWSISGLSYKCFIAPCQPNYNCGGVIQSSKICQHAEMSWVVKESELLRDAVELRPPPPTMCSLCVTWVKLCQTTFWFLKVQFVTFLWESSFYLQIIADVHFWSSHPSNRRKMPNSTNYGYGWYSEEQLDDYYNKLIGKTLETSW